MTKEEMEALKVGDIIRSIYNRIPYVVTGNYSGHVTAVNSVNMVRPPEWEVIKKGIRSE